MFARAAAALVVLATVSACGGKPPREAKTTSDTDSAFEAAVAAENDSDQKEPLTAPAPSTVSKGAATALPPFTWEQIRAATKSGRAYRYRVEVAGRPAHERVLKFAKVDDSGVEIETGSSSRRVGWSQLQRDAEWPKDKVTIHEETNIRTPGGKFDCVVYELRGDAGETITYFFAKSLPGAPVLFYTEQDGRRIKTTTLLQHTPGRDS